MKKFYLQYCIILFVVLYLFGLIKFVIIINSYPINDVGKNDAIIVFTGSKQRISTGFHLYQKKISPLLLISGVKSNFFKNYIKEELLNSHNDYSHVYLGSAKNTNENIKDLKKWIKQFNLKSVLLVTSNFHIPRSTFLISKNISNIKLVPHPVFNNNIWLIIKEYHKYLYIRLINICFHKYNTSKQT